MNLPFSGRYEKHTFFAAVRAANAPERRQEWVYYLMWMVLGAVGISAGKTYLQTRALQPIVLHLALAALLAAALWQRYMPAWFAARKLWKTAQRPLKGVITEKGIRYHFKEGEKIYAWSDIRRVRVRGNFIALVASNGMLLLFPREFFKRPKDWEKLRVFLQRKKF